MSPDAPALIAAGDIGDCGTNGAEQTAQLLDQMPGTVVTLGDNAQGDGSAHEFQDCYGASWGRHRYRTRPAPGNHDYNTPGASEYFSYFGDRAGPSGRGYYSFTVANWLVLSLNSEIDVSPDSEQLRWLRDTLRQQPSECLAAVWHEPFVSSGPSRGTDRMRAVWALLQQYDADFVLAGHDHFYERFAPVNADGQVDQVSGIRSFIVGTGGGKLMGMVSKHPASVARARTWGVLKVALSSSSYEWAFVSVAGGAVLDRGQGGCQGPKTS